MKILITNDDGIQSPSLLELAKWAQTKGEVTVVAPKFEQSGKSQGIDLFHPFEIKEVPLLPGARCYQLDSTPADCVRFAVLGLKERFDLVLSGINKGLNMGQDIIYSGTVGACFEAVGLGCKAVAVSTPPASHLPAVAALEHVYQYFCQHKLMDYNAIYNVNIPLEGTQIRITRQGGPYYLDHFVCIGGDLYQQEGYCCYEPSEDLTLDTNAVMNNYISITPLTVDRTERGVFALLQGQQAEE